MTRPKPNVLTAAAILVIPSVVAWVGVIWLVVTFKDAGLTILESIQRSI